MSVAARGARLLRIGVIAMVFPTCAPLAFAQEDAEVSPGQDGARRPRHGVAASRPARAPSRDEERAAALARGRQRFFSQVDEFGTDKGPPVPGPGVFPVGPNGLTALKTIPRFGRGR